MNAMQQRQYALTDVGLDILCENIARGISLANSVTLAGISLRTYYNYIDDINSLAQNDERAQGFSVEKIEFLTNLARRLNEAYAEGERKYVSVIEKEAEKGDWKAAVEILKMRFGWGSNDNSTAHKIQAFLEGNVDPEELSDDDLKGVIDGTVVNK